MREGSRREFIKKVGSAGVLAATGGAVGGFESLARGQSYPSANISREDLVHLFEGPWRGLRAVIERKVIDLHSHNFQPIRQGLTQASMNELSKRQENKDFTDDMIEAMDTYGIATSCVSPPKMASSIPYSQFAEAVRRYPGRLIAFCDARGGNTREERLAISSGRYGGTDLFGLDDGKKAAAVIRTRLRDGAKGIGEINYTRMPAAEVVARVSPVVEVAEEFDVPILFGARSGEYAERDPTYIAPIAEKFPKAKIIVGDSGGKGFLYGGGWQAIIMAATYTNLFLEIGGAPVEEIDLAVKNLGAERVVYGCDWGRPDPRPYLPPGHRDSYLHWRNLNAVALSNTSEAQRDLILYKNAARLLKLNPE
jgi:predicted TIM-barrel fold metal-dependent hydrolase